MSDYQPVLTDDGFEIRDAGNNVVWSTERGWQYPPGPEAMEVVFDHENLNTGMRRVLRLMMGIPAVQNERSDSS